MIRVLAAVVVPPHLAMSGGARAAERLSAALSEDCDVTVASMMPADVLGSDLNRERVRRAEVTTSLPAGLPWSWLPPRFRTLFYSSTIPRLVSTGKFDLVHIHNPVPALEMKRIARACLTAHVPYVVSTHGFNEVWNGNRIYGFGPAKRLIWKTLVQDPVAWVVANAAAIFPLSPADVPIIRSMGFHGQNLTLVPNGIESPADGDARSDARALQKFAIPMERLAGQITCAFLANHTPNKGLPILLEAFASLRVPYLLIVGGETRAGINYESYIRRCRPDQRILITGRLSDKEVGAIFRRSNLFVFPTLADTFPLVVIEAMAHGLPVLASRVGGIPYQVREDCGELIEPGDTEALRMSIEALARSPERLAVMGRNARKHATKQFSWSYAANQARTGYQRVLAERITSPIPSPREECKQFDRMEIAGRTDHVR